MPKEAQRYFLNYQDNGGGSVYGRTTSKAVISSIQCIVGNEKLHNDHVVAWKLFNWQPYSVLATLCFVSLFVLI